MTRLTHMMARLQFHQFAWGLLLYNLVVILGGAFVRASISGDGCGNHWPNCNGQFLPDLGVYKTLIEFSHRMSSGLLLPLIVVLVVWAYRLFPVKHPVRVAAVAVVVCTLIEALIGAGLVLFELVAHNQSVSRAIVMPLHLVMTFLLLMALSLTAWWGGGGTPPRLRGQGSAGWLLGLGLLATLVLGITGALTALGDTLFPASSYADVVRQNNSPTHFLQSLRWYHPLVAAAVGLYVVIAAGLTMHLRPTPQVRQFARATMLVFFLQMGAGLLNYALLAPVWMQLVHLLLADLFWVTLVLLTATALAEGVPQVALDAVGPTADPALVRTPATWRDYLALTKPRVISLLLFTTLTAMFIAAGVEGGQGPSFWLCVAVGLGLYMAAGAANAINMVLERDLDLRMGRTATRPTVTATIPPRQALQFALALMVGSFALLWGSANLLTALLALGGLAFYVIVYTLLLKRRTWCNIVIGGAAGAFPPLVGWAAVAGDLSPLAWCLFGIIFLWTPVHFWALAIMIKDDYARAGVPMLPVVRGVQATVVQIAFYTLLTVAISAVPLILTGATGHAAAGGFYLVTAVLLNVVLVLRSFQLYRRPEHAEAKSLFKYSMVYLALLFLAMAVDQAPGL